MASWTDPSGKTTIVNSPSGELVLAVTGRLSCAAVPRTTASARALAADKSTSANDVTVPATSTTPVPSACTITPTGGHASTTGVALRLLLTSVPRPSRCLSVLLSPPLG